MRSARVLTVAAILIGTLGLGVPEATAKTISIKKCPTTILLPGSYVLDNSLTAFGTCITILTDFVTIDLSGHTLTGNTTGIGISEGGVGRRGISITNGTITNFAYGIQLHNSTDGEVRKVRAIGNANIGIWVNSRNTVSDNIATSNSESGISAGSYNTIERNTASFNSVDGISIFSNNTIKNNTASGNFDDGIIAGSNNTISHNTASDNIGDGIVATSNNTISHNTASSNGDDGILVGSNNTISHNTASGNGTVTADGTGITATCSVNNVSNIFGNTAQQNDTNASVAGCLLSNNSF